MRRIHLSMINPQMYLAQPIYHCDSLLLNQGTKDLTRYADKLLVLGINYVYVEDKLCEDIVIPGAVSDKTRYKCREVLQGTLVDLKNDGAINEGPLFEVIDELLEEIIKRPDILISLSDIGTNDDSTLVHSVNSTVFSLLLGKRLNYSKSQLKRLAEGSILHDVGKVLLNQKILFKKGRLNAAEFEHIKQHPTLGYAILKKNPVLTELSRVVCLSHHERMDGSGYPFGLQGDQIHEFARIAAIVDIYDALTSERCYHQALSVREAVDVLTQDSSNKLDASLVALFIKNFAIYPNGTMVLLSDGSYAVIKEQNENMPFRPIVRVFDPWEQVPLYELDLMKELSITIIEPTKGEFKR